MQSGCAGCGNGEKWNDRGTRGHPPAGNRKRAGKPLERKSRACVTHPKYGSVVVPHSSNLAALMNAAEYWGCDWSEITDASVMVAKPGDGPAVKPKEFCNLVASDLR